MAELPPEIITLMKKVERNENLKPRNQKMNKFNRTFTDVTTATALDVADMCGFTANVD